MGQAIIEAVFDFFAWLIGFVINLFVPLRLRQAFNQSFVKHASGVGRWFSDRPTWFQVMGACSLLMGAIVSIIIVSLAFMAAAHGSLYLFRP